LKQKNVEELKALITNDNYVMNLLAIGNFFWKRVIQDMKKPKDIFTDEAVNNAFYAPYANEIQINTGLLQDFGYNLDMPRPIIYGGCVGSTLGHELTHGFDDNGKKYGKHGNLFLWWERSSDRAFKMKTDCMVKQYDNFKINYDGGAYTIDGTNTLGENIADNGGVKLGYRTFLKHLETNQGQCLSSLDFTVKQLFWIGWAQDWCQFNYEGLKYRDTEGGVHAPAPWRVNTVFSNMPEFAADFQCPARAKLNPDERCVVW